MAEPATPAATPDTPFIVDSRGARALHFAMGVIQSRMQLDEPDALDLEYTRLMAALALFSPTPRQIVMVGLGGGSLARFCHRHQPQARIDVVEISAEVIALRQAFEIPDDSPRFHIHQADGALWLRQADVPADWLLVDAFDGQGMPEALTRQRFFDDCRAALAAGGWLALNLHRDDPRFEPMLDRLRRSFDDAPHAPTLLVVDDSDGANAVVLACAGPALARYRAGVVRPPAGLSAAATAALLAAYARTVQALKARTADARPGARRTR